MPIFEVEQNGRVFEVEAPSMEAAATALARRRSAEFSHLPPVYGKEDRVRMAVANQLGIPLSDVDLSRQADLDQRYYLGGRSDTPPERVAATRRLFPGAGLAGAEGHIAVVPPGETTPIFMNPPGGDWGDAAEMGGRIVPSLTAGTAAAAAAAPAGPLVSAVAGAGGVLAAEAAREGVQALSGTQEETLGEFTDRVKWDVGGEFVPALGPAMKIVRRFVSRLGKSATDRVLADALGAGTTEELVQALKIVKDRGVDMPPLMLYQNSDNKILERVSAQIFQFSEAAQQKIVQQLDELANTALEAAPKGSQSADLVLQEGAAARYAGERGRLAGAKPDPEEAGQRLYGSIDSAIEARRADMTRAYQEEVLPLVQELQPRYNLGSVREATAHRVIPAEAKPPQGMEGNRGVIDFGWIDSAEPRQLLDRIDATVRQAGDQQDYQTVFELRRRIGNLLKKSDAELKESGVELGRVKKAYRDYSQLLENPGNLEGEALKRFQRVQLEANKKAADFHNQFRVEGVSDISDLKSTKAYPEAYNEFARNPAKFSEGFREVMSRGDPKEIGELKSNLSRGIMNQDDPLATWNKWVDENPRALHWLYPTERDQMTALRTARELKILNSSHGAKYFDDVYERVGAGEKLLNDHMAMRTGRMTSGVEQARALMRQSDSAQRLALRETVYTKILEPAIETHETTGVKVLNPKVLSEKIKSAEKEGTLHGILNQRDREILDAAKLFARKTYKKGDAGTALAVASQIGQLRQADLKAIASIQFARNMAGLFTSTTISPEVLFSRLSKKPAAAQQPYSTVLGSLARTVNRAGRLSLSTKEEQRGPETLSLPPQLGPTP